MRRGFTTGSCAAAASLAAASMLLAGERKDTVRIITPKGLVFEAQIEDMTLGRGWVSCAVRKDGGDDPDVTTGCLIYSKVALVQAYNSESAPTDRRQVDIEILGGEGVGKVTRPGLDQAVGEAAINSVPRRMITDEVEKICFKVGFCGKLTVTIAVPNGEALSQRTFNPRLGIVGGISILGTSGVVEPMSQEALLKTIRAELSVRRAEGSDICIVSPGNYGREALKAELGYDIDRCVKCSNFIGDTIDMASQLGFRAFLLAGHIGKLVKLAGGITNTHSSNADCRMELMAAAALMAGGGGDEARQVLSCINAEEAVSALNDMGILSGAMDALLDRIMLTLQKRAGSMRIEVIVFSAKSGIIAQSDGAREIIGESS